MQNHCPGMRTITGAMNLVPTLSAPLGLGHAAVILLLHLSAEPQMPIIFPESSTSIEAARETLGRPGISIMLPEITTTKPAPAESDAFVTLRVQPVGAPRRLGSSESEYCVFATQTGNLL